MKTILLACLLTFGCTKSNSEVQRILEREGYTDISLQGYAWFGCSDDDTFANKFVAKKNGQVVEGVVCSGWMKGYTIRTDF